MKSIYKSILSLAVLMAGIMPAWGKQYTTLAGFAVDAGSKCNNSAENYNKLVDDDHKSKWCVTFSYDTLHFVEFHHTEGIYVSGYKLTTGNDNASYNGRNPKDWVLYGKTNKNDKNWTVIHTVTNDKILEDVNLTTYEYNVTVNPVKYRYFRFEISAIQNSSSNVMQLTEFQLVTVDDVTPCRHPKLIHYDSTPGDCAVPATIEYWYCDDCKKTFSDATATTEVTTINASETLGKHVLVHHDSKAATCTTDGYNEYWSCSVCGKNFKDNQGTELLSSLDDIKIAAFNIHTPQVGVETDNNKDYSPYRAYYKTGGCQSLYKASEIGIGGTIKEIAYYCTSSGYDYKRDTKVYMGMTSVEEMSASAPMAESDMKLVYDGTVCIGDKVGWNVVKLDTPFEYDGKNNLVIGIYTSATSYKQIYFTQQSTDYVSTIYRESDTYSYNYNLISTTTYNNSLYTRPVIWFNMSSGHPEDKTECINGIVSCSHCNSVDEVETLSKESLVDTHPYLRTTAATVGDLSYTRNFANADQWEAICLPFAMQFTAENAQDYDLAEINTYGVVSDTNEDGVVDTKDQRTLLASLLSAGDKTKANVPYLIRPKQTGAITFSCIDGKLAPAKPEEITCGTLKETLTFRGVCQAMDSLCDKGYYIMKGGQLAKATAEDAALLPFRWYMKSSSSRTPETINIFVRGEHKHQDKNNDGLCDFCSYSFPIPQVSEENCVSLGLSNQYIGYYIINQLWHLTNALKMMDEFNSVNDEPLKFVMTQDLTIQSSIYNANGKLRSNLKEWKAKDLPEGCIFDGNNHTLRGLVSTKSQTAALFNTVEYGALLCNLGICDSYFGYTSVGAPTIASFAVENQGTIKNCWSSADIATSGGKTGGIVSVNKQGFIHYCTFSGSIYMDAKGVSGKDEKDQNNHIVGGIAAITEQSSINSGATAPGIDHCHYAGTFNCVDGSYSVFGGIYGTTNGFMKTNACWADGRASFDKSVAGARLGGLVGEIPAGLGCGGYPTLYNCYNAMDLSGASNQKTGGLFGSIKSTFSVEACFNIGKIDNGGSSTKSDQMYGYLDEQNCYCVYSYFCYLSETSSEPEYSSNYYGIWGCTKSDFASGKVTNILSAWREYKGNMGNGVKVTSTTDGKYDWMEVGYDTIRSVNQIKEDGTHILLDSCWNTPIDTVVVNKDSIAVTNQWANVDDENPTWTKEYTIGDAENTSTVTLLGRINVIYDTIYYQMVDCNPWYQSKTDTIPVLDSTHGRVVKVNHVTEYYALDGDTLHVQDGYDFASAGRFYAGLATYSRKMSNKWGTICLPFDIHYQVGKPESPYTLFHLHQVTSTEENGVYHVSIKLEEFRSGTIIAGTPMLVRLNTEYISKGEDNKYTLEIVQPKTTAGMAFSPSRTLNAKSWRLNGTVVSRSGDNAFDQYYPHQLFYIARDQFWHVDSYPFGISAFRAWMEFNYRDYNYTEYVNEYRFVMDILDEEEVEETGIQVIENREEGKVEFIYDLSGRRHSVAQPGLNLTRDHKYLVK